MDKPKTHVFQYNSTKREYAWVEKETSLIKERGYHEYYKAIGFSPYNVEIVLEEGIKEIVYTGGYLYRLVLPTTIERISVFETPRLGTLDIPDNAFVREIVCDNSTEINDLDTVIKNNPYVDIQMPMPHRFF